MGGKRDVTHVPADKDLTSADQVVPVKAILTTTSDDGETYKSADDGILISQESLLSLSKTLERIERELKIMNLYNSESHGFIITKDDVE